MDLTDAEAVQRALADPQEFSVIVERYQARLLRYVKRLGISDSDLAKDMLQESFIKVYVNLNDYDSSLSFSSWVYRITHNEVMQYFRYMKNRPHSLPAGDIEMLFGTLPDELDIAEESDAKLQKTHVAQALQMIDSLYRDVLILRFYEEKSYQELSDILRMPMGTVGTNIQRAKKKLKNELEKQQIDLYYETNE